MTEDITQSTEVPRMARSVGDRSLADKAYEVVLQMITNGEFSVGSRLPTEHVLSKQAVVSRPILRRALKQLREDGIISSRQGSGSYVLRRPEGLALRFAPVETIADIQRTFEFRTAVEGEAAYLAAQRRTAADLDRLKAALDDVDQCILNGEIGVEPDEAFHAAVCVAADNSYFVTTRASLKPNILNGMNVTHSLSLTKTKARLELVQKEHFAIYDAIVAGDAEGARQTMRDHVTNSKRRIFEGTPS